MPYNGRGRGVTSLQTGALIGHPCTSSLTYFSETVLLRSVFSLLQAATYKLVFFWDGKGGRAEMSLVRGERSLNHLRGKGERGGREGIRERWRGGEGRERGP
eukprot:sb/3478411/